MLDAVTKGIIQPQLIKFPKFTINIAHIVSIVCEDMGLPRISSPDDVNNADPDGKKMRELNEKIGKL